MTTKTLNPLDIEGKIEYPCDAFFRHKTLTRRGGDNRPITCSFGIGSWLYESEGCLKKYLYQYFIDRQEYLSWGNLEDVELIVTEYTLGEYIAHVKNRGGSMAEGTPGSKGYIKPADDDYITKIYNQAKSTV